MGGGGEVLVSSEEFTAESGRINDGSSGGGGVVRWERFLHRRVLRVLLVESDDSTRQIIAALLRKCSYRVVAVSDGLKAWGVLTGRPQNIDLILTEVDLPSISGFALLTLIMEHEICKGIPVIMMSSQDSINTVYNCMLKGAADFLVKPVRRNELKNLWQHVWRRQSSTSGGNGPQDESIAQQKVEATSENNAASNQSSGFIACIQRNKECIEKGSDAQSSSTKPDVEAESPCMENVHEILQRKLCKAFASDMKAQEHEKDLQSDPKYLIHDCEAQDKDANTKTQDEDMEPESHNREISDADVTHEARDNDDVLFKYREVIDLIGGFDNYPSYRIAGSNKNIYDSDTSPHLDLSLRRAQPSTSEDQVGDERHALHHSNGSAFSRYVNRTSQPLNATALGVCTQPKEYETNSDKHFNHASGYGPTLNSERSGTFSPTRESSFQCHQQRVFSVPGPVKGMRFDIRTGAYGPGPPPLFYSQSGPSPPIPSPSLATRQGQEPALQVNQFHQSSLQEQKLEALDDRGHISSATDQSTSSSFCNGNAVVRANVVENGNQEGFFAHDGSTHRSSQREAALNKFRLKRKDRCYEKKVRYESRKKLAEQRPRVKGQFVRQAQTDPPMAENDNYMGNFET